MRVQAVYVLICATLISCLAHADGHQSVRIVSPEPDATVHDNNGDLTVMVEVSPPLHAETGDYLAVLLDGKAAAKGTTNFFELKSIDRGSHTLRVRVKAADGTVIASSPTLKFFMWRASRLFRGARAQVARQSDVP